MIYRKKDREGGERDAGRGRGVMGERWQSTVALARVGLKLGLGTGPGMAGQGAEEAERQEGEVKKKERKAGNGVWNAQERQE